MSDIIFVGSFDCLSSLSWSPCQTNQLETNIQDDMACYLLKYS